MKNLKTLTKGVTIGCVLFLVLGQHMLYAGGEDTLKTSSKKKTVSQKTPILRPIHINNKKVGVSFKGQARFQARYRNLTENWPNPGDKTGGSPAKNLNINGFGDNYENVFGLPPLLRLEGEVTPSANASVNFIYFFNHILSGQGGDTSRLIFPSTQRFEAKGEFKTPLGKFNIYGGNTMVSLSQIFSGWQNPRYYPYYRTPWDWYAEWDGAWAKYEDFYENNAGMRTDPIYTSGGRIRGIAIQGTELPANLGLNFFYGANMQTGVGLVEIDEKSITKKTWGGKLYYSFGSKNKIGYNAIVNSGFIDNVSSDKEAQFMNSLNAFLTLGDVTIHPEVGFGFFKQPYGQYNGDSAFFQPECCGGTYESGLDEIINIEVNIDKDLIGVPVKAQVYSLGADIVNRNASFVNTSTHNNADDYIRMNVEWDVNIRRGAFTHVHQIANNRRGFILGTDFDLGRLKMGVRTNVGKEIENRHQVISFEHKLNAFSRAGFNFWDAQSGPYNRLLYQFIQLFETLPITDTLVDYRKTFNVTDLDLRYKTRFLKKNLILTNYTSYQSVSDQFSPLPYFTDNAFVRVVYNELMTYYSLNKELTLIGHAAYHKAIGNNRTALSPENNKPINQTSWAFGGGLDWNFHDNMGLYARQLWMGHKDQNFKLDRFKGWETTFELKIFF